MGISSCSSSADQDVAKSQSTVLDRLSSPSSDYLMECVMGEGTYGQVVKCVKAATKETVAVKIFKSTEFTSVAQNEVDNLRCLMSFDSERFNFVRCNNIFIDRQHLCIEFEILDRSLVDFIDKRPSSSLSVKEIRPIVYQMATTLQLLRSLGLVHMDLKPDNIMMVDCNKQPFRVKLIDFGFAQHASDVRSSTSIPLCNYRSPEVILGLPITPAIDMWSLGCVAAELYLGQALYPNIYENHLGLYDYGHLEHLDILNKVKPILHLSAEDTLAEMKDQENFVDLVKMMLNLDVGKRITPRKMLQHPFITMISLAESFPNSFYVNVSFELMKVCLERLSCDAGSLNDPVPGESQFSDLDGSPVSSDLSKRVTPAWHKHREHPLVLNTLVDMSRLSIRENPGTPKRRRGRAWRKEWQNLEALRSDGSSKESALAKMKKMEFDSGLFQISKTDTKPQRKRTIEESSSQETGRKKGRLKDMGTQTDSLSSRTDTAGFPQCLRNRVLQVPDVVGAAFRAVTGMIHTCPLSALTWFKNVLQQFKVSGGSSLSPSPTDQTNNVHLNLIL